MYRTITLYGSTFQKVPLSNLQSTLQSYNPNHCRNNIGLGCSPFARHYLGNHYCFLFLRVLRCFSSPGLLPDYSGYPAFSRMGCPIRKSPDQRLFAPPRSLSQLITSFIASESQGIHHTLLITFLLISYTFASIYATHSLYFLSICQRTLFLLN